MKILRKFSGEILSNVYFVINDEKRAVVIDPGEDYALIKKTEKENGFKIDYALITHGHFDHCMCAAKLQADGVKIAISVTDEKCFYSDYNLAADFGREFPPLKADILFDDGDTLHLDGMDFTVIATPGHSEGACCFLFKNALFSGDTLFSGTIGATDKLGGDYATLIKSLKKLKTLPPETNVYPGHGLATTIERELKVNPYFKAK